MELTFSADGVDAHHLIGVRARAPSPNKQTMSLLCGRILLIENSTTREFLRQPGSEAL